MSIAAISFILAALCFLLLTLEVALGDLNLLPLGLLFLAIGFVLERTVGNRTLG